MGERFLARHPGFGRFQGRQFDHPRPMPIRLRRPKLKSFEPHQAVLLGDAFHQVDVPLIAAGDFNQGRSGRRWSYGTKTARRAVTDGLSAAGLACLTEIDLVASGAISEPSHVEHICASTDLEQVGEVHAWDRTDQSGKRLSDHPTIAVDLARVSEDQRNSDLGRSGLPRGEVTPDLACPMGGPGRMTPCPSRIPRSSATMS